MVKPLTGQANFSEKMMRPSGGVSGEDLALGGFLNAAATPVRSAPGGSSGGSAGSR